MEAIKKRAEVENNLTLELSEEFIGGFLQEYQQEIQNHLLDYDYSLIDWRSNLLALIADNNVEWKDNWEWEDLNQINADNGIGFYERRMEKIKTLLNAEYSYGNYSDTEKEYWMKKAQAIPTPFAWGSKNTWDMIWTSISLLFFQLFVISICLAPVFSGEYQNRTDALILSAKHGKGKLIHAKILASFLFTFSYIAASSIISMGINVLLLGIEGWNLPVQLWNTIIPYRLAAFEACGINLLLMFLIAFLLTAISLLFSALCKSQMIVLAVDILLFFGAVFLPSSKTSSLWNHILCLFPIHSFNLKNVLEAYISYPFGDMVVSQLEMIVVVYGLIIMACVFYTGKCFKNHQIGK